MVGKAADLISEDAERNILERELNIVLFDNLIYKHSCKLPNESIVYLLPTS
jgi:hypothetical protein